MVDTSLQNRADIGVSVFMLAGQDCVGITGGHYSVVLGRVVHRVVRPGIQEEQCGFDQWISSTHSAEVQSSGRAQVGAG